MAFRLPRLLDGDMQEIQRPVPGSVSIMESLRPLSSATVTLEQGIAQVGQFMELYTIHGSAGIYRIEQIETEHAGIDTLHLQHGLVTLSDALQTGSGEKTGTPQELLSMLLAGQSRWRLGVVEATKQVTWAWDYSTILDGVLALLDAMPGYRLTFEQHGPQWVLNLVALDDSDFCEVRLSRNVSSLQMETDRSDLCTRLYVPGMDAPMDADTIGKWGVVARRLDADPEIGQEAINRLASEYLDKHKEPKISMTISAIDWYQETGVKLDHFAIGRMCRVCLPGQVVRQRITGITTDGFEPATLTLENETTGAESAIASLIVDTTEIRKHVRTEFERVDERIIAAENLIKLSAADIELLAKRITANAEQITLKASAEVVDGLSESLDGALISLDGLKSEIALKVSKDGIISAINLAPGSAVISADKIELKGDTIVQLLLGRAINAAKFEGELAQIGTVEAARIDVGMGGLVLGGQEVTEKTQTVVSSLEGLSLQFETLKYKDHDGVNKTARVVTSVSLNVPSTRSLKYLGRS